MSGRDLRRAGYLKELLERQVSKVGSLSKAEERMDALFGPSWRVEINPDDVEVHTVDDKGAEPVPSGEARESFYDRVRQAGDDADMGWLHSEYSENEEASAASDRDSGRPSLRSLLEELLGKLRD